MSLTKRDTFVRYVDPMHTMWEDAEGNLHFSVDNALKAFELEDTPENRQAVQDIYRKSLLDADPNTVILDRAQPDTEDYWKQVHPDNRPAKFRHMPYEKPPNA